MKKIVYFAIGLLLIGLIGTIVTFPKADTLKAYSLFQEDKETTRREQGGSQNAPDRDRQETPNDLNGIIEDFQTDLMEGSTDMVGGILDNVSEIVDDAVSHGNIEYRGNDDWDDPDNAKSRRISLSENLAAKGIRNIVIDTAASDVKLNTSAASEIEARLTGKVRSGIKDNELTPLLNKEGDTLYIQTERERKDGKSFRADLALTVTIPAAQPFGKLSISTVNGDVEASNLEVKQAIKLETTNGEITLNRAEAAKIELSSVNGSIEASALKGEIAVSSVNGDLDLGLQTDDLAGDITAESIHGDIDIALKEHQPLSLEFTTATGEAEVDIPDMDFSSQTDQGLAGKVGSGKYSVKATTTTGDFTLE
ncbi:DUF4097 family beta strand repeat-containing protein [Paenibacillus macerans]|uniref:DUF4097 family beta strand repeat-containing protein n=1 Tax=Paenibacillus macerans TaxID=44252 RepID=UPI002041421F|nr:DUF4097 family beta strand repeat-containing protein [Paenibacillus macerans]MCM3702874.1 DUF4097 domain-containing protein [Paenibacillus macerans]